MPFLLMVLNAEVDTLRVIHSFVSGIKNFLVFRFGLNLLKLLAFEWDTLFPFIALFPVKSQIFDMSFCIKFIIEGANIGKLFQIIKSFQSILFMVIF